MTDKKPTLKPLSNEDKKLLDAFNACAAALAPVLKAHKEDILSTGMSFNDATRKPEFFFIILDKNSSKDASDIPSTVGPEKLPVKIVFQPRA